MSLVFASITSQGQIKCWFNAKGVTAGRILEELSTAVGQGEQPESIFL